MHRSILTGRAVTMLKLTAIARRALTWLTAVAFTFGTALYAQESQPAAPAKITLIYDGDIGPDPCDFTTLSMLHEYHRHGKIELVGVVGETPDPYLASTFSIYNQLYQNDVLIGAYNPKAKGIELSGAVIRIRTYQKAVSDFCYADQNKTIFKKFSNSATLTADKVLVPVEAYRKLLSEADDDSITIYAAGQLFNFPSLLKSPGDKYSKLSGEQLVRRKVKELVFMGGNFPDSKKSNQHKPTGAEWNWWALGNRNTTKVTMDTLTKMGKSLTFIGYEQGIKVRVGQKLTEKLGRKHPTTESYYLYRHTAPNPADSDKKARQLVRDNPAFDDLGLFYAVEGGVGKYFRRVRGQVRVDEVGANTWIPDQNGNHAYITIIPGREKELCKILSARITGNY